MAKSIVLGPEVWLDCVIAARRLPDPLSALLLTVKVLSICRPSINSTEKLRHRSSLRRAARSSRRLRNQEIDIAGVPYGLCGRRTGGPDHAARAPRRARRWIASSRDRAPERGRGRRGPRTDLASVSTSPSVVGGGHRSVDLRLPRFVSRWPGESCPSAVRRGSPGLAVGSAPS